MYYHTYIITIVPEACRKLSAHVTICVILIILTCFVIILSKYSKHYLVRSKYFKQYLVRSKHFKHYLVRSKYIIHKSCSIKIH